MHVVATCVLQPLYNLGTEEGLLGLVVFWLFLLWGEDICMKLFGAALLGCSWELVTVFKYQV